jgi:hypothetical protein
MSRQSKEKRHMKKYNSDKVIGYVSDLLKDKLSHMADIPVTVGHPSSPKKGKKDKRLNLFLYAIEFDHTIKNVDLEQDLSLCLILKYILTAFDETDRSDSVEAHEYLGKGIRSLQQMNFLSFGEPAQNTGSNSPDDETPEALKITFDESSPDLISKLTRGIEDKYHPSIAFQVRPVMIKIDNKSE